MKKHYFAIHTVILLLITSSFYMDKNCFNFDLISLKSKMSNNDYSLDLEKSKLKYMFNSPQLMDTYISRGHIRIYCFNSADDAKKRLDTLINMYSKHSISKPEYENVYVTFFLYNSLIVLVDEKDEKALNTLTSTIGSPYYSIIKEWPNPPIMELI
ncbi:hypothetical protein FDC58_00740 [Clostridium botulinum]|uniref:hypothetical protein n=1 Tax=unclassified Clostridium TaxID=2614128 RepID=UPI000505C4BB|nr:MULTISPECIES: hypothetical protein [unclassified Clostridium]AIY79220.1 hypothetical protein U728_2044 [Clostridium botulinum 202F]KAI3347625.1 hypothetical protein CIT17_05070 [Clostridium botulinum]KFX59577.1 hypothetical protein KU40_00920 [Clostridium botulinum]KON14384.1 hypothetical protein ACP50_02380 [Clostridium botulinum]MBY6779332.1 hypothetical protein [Clostridium botulinum]